MRLHAKRSGSRRAGFTLVEVIIASTLTVMASTAVITTLLMITAASYRTEQYVDMEAESRKSLELFGQDVRMAQSINWTDINSVTLTIPLDDTETPATTSRTYRYVPANRTFVRITATGTEELLTNVDEFFLMGYTSSGNPTHNQSAPPMNWGTVNNSTKQLQLSLSCSRTRGEKLKSSQKVLSARFILRNHHVTS